jgi:RHS repeat-associated protein
MGQRLLARASIVGASAAALVAGLLAGSSASAAPAADPVTARATGGLESLGPIETVRAQGAAQWPATLPTVAVLPRGSAMHGNYPLVYIPGLRDEPTVELRVVDLSQGSAGGDGSGWAATARNGWAKIDRILTPGRSFAIDVRSQQGWVRAGTFTVAQPGSQAGPSIGVDGIRVSTITGNVSWSWQSPVLAGPTSALGLTLTWGSGVPAAAGLPQGWRIIPGTGSPWAGLETASTTSTRVTAPSGPRVRVEDGVAEVQVMSQDPSQVLGQRVQVMGADGAWSDAGVVDAQGGQVRANVGDDDARVRVCVDIEGTALCGASTAVTGDGTYIAPRARDLTPRGGLQSERGPRVVTVRGWDGSALVFERTAQGLYEQVTGAGRVPGLGNTLDRLSNGSWEFTDSAATTTRFVDGRAVSVEKAGAVVARLEWDSAGRLVRLTNEIARAIRLTYSGSGDCPSSAWTAHGFAAPATGSLCRVVAEGGDASDFGYVSAGDGGAQIALIKSAGNAGTALGWDSRGRLVSERSAIVGRAALVDPRAASVLSRVEYDDRGRAANLVDQPSTIGAPSVARTVAFPSITEESLKAWIKDPRPEAQAEARVALQGSGYSLARRDFVDPTTWQVLRSIDKTGLSQRLVGDLVDAGTQTSIDEQGRQTRIKRDELGRQVSTAGPSTRATSLDASDAQRTTTDYDVDIDGTKRIRLAGLRAQVFPDDMLGGRPDSAYWAVPRGGSGLSYRWQGPDRSWSALATGVWRPSEGLDKAGARDGWTFRVEASGGRVLLMVGAVACEPATGTDTCTLQGLGKGPKQVTVQLTAGRGNGAFSVQAAPVGQSLAALELDSVRPEFSNATVTTSNDVYRGSAKDVRTITDYPDPASGQVGAVTDPAGRTVRFDHEDLDPSRGVWGRQLRFTTAGGEVVRTGYWPVSDAIALPPACGSGTAVGSGQPATVTRQDGTKITTYYDIRGRQTASITEGDGLAQVQCNGYHSDGSMAYQRTYSVARAGEATLLEDVQVSSGDPQAGGDPLTFTTTVTLGPGAPVGAGTSVQTTVTTDLRGRPVRSVDASGTVTTWAHDAAGQLTSVTYDGPDPGPVTTVGYAYRTQLDGAVEKVSIGGVAAATVTYDRDTGRIASVEYPGSRASYAYGPDGRVRGKTIVASSGERYSHAVTRTDFGRTLEEATTGPGLTDRRAYSYDDAGRLTRAVMSATTGAPRSFEYSFNDQAAACGTGYLRAGEDNLRTAGSRDGVAYTMCHDAKGRIVSSTDPLLTGGQGPATFRHDGLGRVVAVEGIDRPVSLAYGIGGQVLRMREGIDTTAPITTEFTSYSGNVLTRRVTTAGGTEAISYGAGGALQLATDDSGAVGAVIAAVLDLPGGARVTIPATGGATLTHDDATGNALATLAAPALGGAAAAGLGPADRVGPYGERLGQVDLATQSAAPTYRWHASTRADTLPGAAGIVIVGARAYLPATGQFLSADPLVDSGQNLYGYTDGDPVNAKDSSGNESDTDWTWVWVAAASALLTLAIGVGGASAKGNLPKGWSGSSSSWSKFKAVARANPGKTALYGLGVVSSVTAGVGAAMAVRNQVSESWQAIAIGIGAAAATFGAGYLGAKAVAGMRKARFNKKLAQESRGSWVDFERSSTRSNSVASYSQASATQSVQLRVQYQKVIPAGEWIPSKSLGGFENRASFLDQGSFSGDVFGNRFSVGSVGSAYGS